MSATAARLVADLAPHLDGQVQHRIPAFLPPLMAAHNAILSIGGGMACWHIDERSPDQVAHVAVWSPGRMVCGPCALDGALTAGISPRENWLCDRCGEYREREVSASVAQVGRFLVWFGVCRPCRALTITECGGVR